MFGLIINKKNKCSYTIITELLILDHSTDNSKSYY